MLAVELFSCLGTSDISNGLLPSVTTPILAVEENSKLFHLVSTVMNHLISLMSHSVILGLPPVKNPASDLEAAFHNTCLNFLIYTLDRGFCQIVWRKLPFV